LAIHAVLCSIAVRMRTPGSTIGRAPLSPLLTPGPTVSTCCWIPSGFCLPFMQWVARIRSSLASYELLQAAIATIRSIAATSGRASFMIPMTAMHSSPHRVRLRPRADAADWLLCVAQSLPFGAMALRGWRPECDPFLPSIAARKCAKSSAPVVDWRQGGVLRAAQQRAPKRPRARAPSEHAPPLMILHPFIVHRPSFFPPCSAGSTRTRSARRRVPDPPCGVSDWALPRVRQPGNAWG